MRLSIRLPPHAEVKQAVQPASTLRIVHGGAVDAAAAHYRIPREDWLDLSTGISPYPYPVLPLKDIDFHRLPDAEAEERLRVVAARYYGAPGGAAIVSVPGSQSAIQWLPRLLAPSRVAVVSPTYAEHAKTWRAAGHTVSDVGSLDDIIAKTKVSDRATVVVVVNPNNPDGQTFNPEMLAGLADRHFIVVDEAFCDLDPSLSAAPYCDRPGLVVLKSIGKFFGLAGLRLGFVVSADDVAVSLQRAVGPWAVSGPALQVGASALGDRAWIVAARQRIHTAAARLRRLLREIGLNYLGGTDLFSLVSHDRASELFEHLARAGILVRRFDKNPVWLRVGLPGDDRDFRRLERVLAAWNAGSACRGP